LYSHRIDPCPILMTCFFSCAIFCIVIYRLFIKHTNGQTYAFYSNDNQLDLKYWLVSRYFFSVSSLYESRSLLISLCRVIFNELIDSRVCACAIKWRRSFYDCVYELYTSFSLLVMARMRNNWMRHVLWFVSNTSYKLLMLSIYYITTKEETLSIILSTFYNWKFKVECQ
jgi:hypothetical protein